MKKTLLVLKELRSVGIYPRRRQFYLIEKELGDEVHQSSVYSGTYVIVDHHARIISITRYYEFIMNMLLLGIIKDESPTNYEEAMMGPNVPIDGIVPYNPK